MARPALHHGAGTAAPLIFRKLENRFRLVLPTKFETIEVQPYPYYFGYATLVYTVAQPNEQIAAELDRIMQEDNT